MIARTLNQVGVFNEATIATKNSLQVGTFNELEPYIVHQGDEMGIATEQYPGDGVGTGDGLRAMTSTSRRASSLRCSGRIPRPINAPCGSSFCSMSAMALSRLAARSCRARKRYRLTLAPGYIDRADGSIRAEFPGVKEEVLELVLTKLAMDKGYFTDAGDG